MPDYVGTITMRTGDQLPTLSVAVETDTGVPVDLTGATAVNFVFSNHDGQDPRVAPPVGGEQVDLVLPGYVVNAAQGIVAYDWGLADSFRPGTVQVVVVAHLPSGTIAAPSDRTARIQVRPDAFPG